MVPTTGTICRSEVQPFRDTRLDPSLRIRPGLGMLIGGALALGLITATAPRRKPLHVRALRGVLASSAATYLLTVALDSAEHFRLEKEVTGSYVRWKAVPFGESSLHLFIVADVLAALTTARRPRRRARGRDHVILFAPAVFLAIGWLDEILYHRRRVSLREEIIHATQHISEGMMWTALYALRFLTKH